MSTTMDFISVTELDLYACNFSGEHYNQVDRVLSKFHKKGTFSLDRAIPYVERNLVMPAAKDYLLVFGSMTDSLRTMFPKSLRMAVAELITRRFVDEYRLGNFYD